MGWGGSVAEWGCPPDTFQSTFSAVASGLCFFCTCSGGGVRDISFVGGTATQPPSVTWCHLVREALVICVLVIGSACFMCLSYVLFQLVEQALGIPQSPLFYR